MGALECELCGSSNLIKQDGVFVCQSCGCKYSVAEAKRLIVEGTVKTDESNKVSNYFNLAEAAYANSNWTEAYTYYCKVLEFNPNDWVSIYKKGFCIGWQSNLTNIRYNEVIGGITDSIKCLMNEPKLDKPDKANGIVNISIQLYNWALALYNSCVNHTNEYSSFNISVCKDFYEWMTLISQIMTVQLELFNEFVVMNADKLDEMDKFFNDTALSFACIICLDLKTSFDSKTGKKLQPQYEDFYEKITPSYQATNANESLIKVIGNAEKNFSNWKKIRLEREKQARIEQYWKNNPDEYVLFQSKEKELEKAKEAMEKANIKLTNAEKNLLPVTEEYSKLNNIISENNSKIDKLRKKIFGRRKAEEEANLLEKTNSEHNKRLKVIQSQKDDLSSVAENEKLNVKNKEDAVTRLIEEISVLREKAEGCKEKLA